MDEININTEFIKEHWLILADEDFQTMKNLLKSGDNCWSLFIGHLVIEKILKAIYVSRHKSHPPFSHDLLRLAKQTGIELNSEIEDKLDVITTFNINARYDDYKREFKKLCTNEFTDKWINTIVEVRQWLMNQF